jgi:hypothetical protein
MLLGTVAASAYACWHGKEQRFTRIEEFLMGTELCPLGRAVSIPSLVADVTTSNACLADNR